MSSDPWPRFMVLEQKQDQEDGGRVVCTILDRWYSHDAVWRYETSGDDGWIRPPIVRAAAATHLHHLNAAHDAWLADA